jgi:hypothetical protein
LVIAILCLLAAVTAGIIGAMLTIQGIQQEISSYTAGLGVFAVGLVVGFLGLLMLLILVMTRGGHKEKLADYEQRVAAHRQHLGELVMVLGGMIKTRGQILRQIATGDLRPLADFQPYLMDQEATTLVYPAQGELGFNPARGETCLLQTKPVTLGRVKQHTRVEKIGGGYRVFRYYVPVKKQRVQFTALETQDTGVLAITNKRVLFLGKVKKLSSRFDQILEIHEYTDGIAITKEGRQGADYFTGFDGPLAKMVIAGMQQGKWSGE